MLPKQKLREVVFQVVYSKQFGGIPSEDAIPFVMEHFEVTKKNAFTVLNEASHVFDEMERIDGLIRQVSKEYSVERIGAVEKAILHVLLYELESKKIDEEVAVAEGGRLSKKFSHDAAGTFVVAIVKEVNKECFNNKKS